MPGPRYKYLVLALVANEACAQTITNSTLYYASERPSSAMSLPANLCGFSIEPDRYPEWAGNYTHKNAFTYTLMDTLKNKTGVAPRIRQVQIPSTLLGQLEYLWADV
jgi:hypothetical protein